VPWKVLKEIPLLWRAVACKPRIFQQVQPAIAISFDLLANPSPRRNPPAHVASVRRIFLSLFFLPLSLSLSLSLFIYFCLKKFSFYFIVQEPRLLFYVMHKFTNLSSISNAN